MLKKAFFAFLPLLLLVAIPVLMQPPQNRVDADLKLVIITPHNESIRYEFGRAFSAWYQERHGEPVAVEWRTPGGTSDIVRYIDDQFRTAFIRDWQREHGKSPSDEHLAAFNDRKFDAEKASPEAAQARRRFLASDVGIGIDLFFGGGQYEFYRQAGQGHLVDAGLIDKHPAWFADAVIPQTYSGEVFYDPQGRYYGTCLSAFGICYNPDRVAMLEDDTPPRRWSDLGQTRFYQQTGVADPTKSGSITKCFEMLIQQQMQEEVKRVLAAGGSEAEGVAAGWREGLNLIKRIGANARYVTDSASKIPHDVGKGDTTAGMCIDFYGRAEAEWTAFQSGNSERIVYVTPEGGSSISVDPIALFRGAPNRELGIAFIEFVLSEEGQKIWNYKVGTPGGPEQYALRRLPVRRDMYGPEHRRHMADANQYPFEEAKDFVYQPGWTAVYFGLIRTLVRSMALDPSVELRQAWGVIIAAGGPEAVPEAMEAFNRLPFAYANAGDANDALNAEDKLEALRQKRQWAEFFRDNYQEAQAIAERHLRQVARQ